MTGPGYFDGRTPRILAHRGLALEHPGNTMAAFEAALAAGADILESDVQATADGVPVLLHDATFTTVDDPARTRAIATVTSGDLASLALDASGQTIPTLAEALRALPEARFNLDIKAGPAAEVTADAIREAGAERRVLVTSFSDSRRRRAIAGLDVATSPSARAIWALRVAAAAGRAGVIRRIAGRARAAQMPETHRLLPPLTRGAVETIQRAGLEVHVWTVNDPADMRRLVELGVDGIVTDRTDLAVTALRPGDPCPPDGSKSPA